MRILTEPKVYLIARPQVVEEGLEAFLSDQGLGWPTPREGVSPAAGLVETAGRCCYMTFGKKAGTKTNREYINNILGREIDGSFRKRPAHGSVLEHPTWTFLVVGGGRGFSHEQVRHRAGWAYSQLSTRYCDFERASEEGTWEPGFCIPPLAQLSQESQSKMEILLAQSQVAYTDLLDSIMEDLKQHPAFTETLSKYSPREARRVLRRAARGAARDILPIGTEAIMVMTANARAIWNCIYLRASVDAEAVIRNIYVQLARIMEMEFPELFYGLEFIECWDGTEAVILPREKL